MISSLIHPSLRSPQHKDHRKATAVAWFIFLLVVSVILYDIYFWVAYPEDTVKQMTNLVGLVLFLLSVTILRFSSRINYGLVYLVIVSLPPTMFSVYQTGGIYSADLAWLLLTAMGTYILIDVVWGLVVTVIILLYISVLYYFEAISITGDNTFNIYLQGHNGHHYFFTWVFLLILMSILLGTFTIIQERTNKKLDALSGNKIKELEEEVKKATNEISALRSNIAKDFHDEMGNKLASINILSQTAALHINSNTNPEEINAILSTIELRSNELYHGTKDFIWSIDFKNDYINELFIYIRDFGESFFNQLDISYYSEKKFDENKLSRLDPASIRQLVFICKEIMTNSAKHSACSEVVFTMLEETDQLIIVIADNGTGFNIDQVTQRGINNIYKRLSQIKGTCDLKSVEKGTVYRLSVPLYRPNLPI